MKNAVEILQQYWGHSTFRYPQETIIRDVVEKQDVIAVLPTGSGKSICFQVPTLMSTKGVCIVVSPLIALMKDQVKHLEEKGIKAVALIGSIPRHELIRIFDNIQFGGIGFLYLSPERLQNEFIQTKIKQLDVNLIAIDEAHCISEWGHDFRPSYLQLHILREIHPHANIIALTATATPKVVKDIEIFLKLKETKIYKKSIQRDNLYLKVIESTNKHTNVLYQLKSIDEPAIVYAGSRKKCAEISDFLNQKGVKSTYYHAGLSAELKEISFRKWKEEEVQVMVATNAFGMGIDKANVRMVIHANIPTSIENYTQEAGRAGRDGKTSFAVLIESLDDINDSKKVYSKSIPDVTFIKRLYAYLNQYFSITYGDLPTQSFDFTLSSFCQRYQLSIVKTFNGLQLLEREGILVFSNQTKALTRLGFKANSEQLYAYYERNPQKSKILKSILRTYDGVFDSIKVIDIHKIAKKTNLNKAMVHKHLSEASKDGFIHYLAAQNSNTILFLQARQDNYTINSIAKRIELQQEVKQDKYKSMCAYITNSKTCRNIQISMYFGETAIQDCGICDVCISKKKDNTHTIYQINTEILDYLKGNKAMTSRELVQMTGINDTVLLNALQGLLDSDEIVVNSQNRYRLKQ